MSFHTLQSSRDAAFFQISSCTSFGLTSKNAEETARKVEEAPLTYKTDKELIGLQNRIYDSNETVRLRTWDEWKQRNGNMHCVGCFASGAVSSVMLPFLPTHLLWLGLFGLTPNAIASFIGDDCNSTVVSNHTL